MVGKKQTQSKPKLEVLVFLYIKIISWKPNVFGAEEERKCLWIGWPVCFILWACLLSKTCSLGESGQFGCGGEKIHGWDPRHSTTNKSSLENSLVWGWSSQRCRINSTECRKLQLSKGFPEYLTGYHILLTPTIDTWKCVHRHKCVHAMHVCVCLWTSKPPEPPLWVVFVPTEKDVAISQFNRRVLHCLFHGNHIPEMLSELNNTGCALNNK